MNKVISTWFDWCNSFRFQVFTKCFHNFHSVSYYFQADKTCVHLGLQVEIKMSQGNRAKLADLQTQKCLYLSN